MEEITNTNLPAALEAILFSYGEPLPLKRIVTMTGASEEACLSALKILEEKYKTENQGLELLNHDSEIQLVTKAAFQELLHTIIKEELNEELSPATLETLGIIAYGKGEITRATIDYIRGVNSSFMIRTLLMRGLIERKTSEKKNTYAYGLSLDFLKHLGISKIEDLPEYERLGKTLEDLKSAEA
jgi:segregation and condensation protein B